MAQQTPEQLIDLLCARAAECRDAGILSLTLPGVCEATFAPAGVDQPDWAEAVPAKESLSKGDEEEFDALMSHETFNLPEGADLPGYYANRDRTSSVADE